VSCEGKAAQGSIVYIPIPWDKLKLQMENLQVETSVANCKFVVNPLITNSPKRTMLI